MVQRRPRPACGDIVLIASTSSIYLLHQSHSASVNNHNRAKTSKCIQTTANKRDPQDMLLHHILLHQSYLNHLRLLHDNGEEQEISVFIEDEFESNHFYESVSSNEQDGGSDTDDYDSFDSDTDSEHQPPTNNQTMDENKFDHCQLPPTPTESNAAVYSLSKLANRAGKHMQRLKKNWFLTKNDLTKSLGRITRKKTSQTEIKIDTKSLHEASVPYYENTSFPIVSNTTDDPVQSKIENSDQQQQQSLEGDGVHLRKISTPEKRLSMNSASNSESSTIERRRAKKKQWSMTSRFKRSISLSGEMLSTNVLQAARNSLQPTMEKPQSTFYLHDIPTGDNKKPDIVAKSASLSPITGQMKSNSASPIDNKGHKKTRSSSSSWYTDNEIYAENNPTEHSIRASNTCWYAEIGLYSDLKSTCPGAESSDSFSSTYSTSTHQETINDLLKKSQNVDRSDDTFYSKEKPYVKLSDTNLELSNQQKQIEQQAANEDIQLMLQDEPLYQFYTAEKLESGMRDLGKGSLWSGEHEDEGVGDEADDSDGYEQIGEGKRALTIRPSAMQLIRPSSPGQSRTLWCEVPQVISSNLLNVLNIQQKKLQEAKFELITSEASYLNSLNVLCSHFKKTILSDVMLTEEDKNLLFGNIEPVKKCAENLLTDLENCWQNDILLHGVCDILRKHATDHFSVYISYCENQVYIEQTLKRLKEQHSEFANTLIKLESSPVCHSLPLHSFLMLPMQRITRLPLLLDAILKRLANSSDEYEPCQLALATVNQVVEQCNEAARQVEQRDEFKRTWAKLEFPSSKPTVNTESCRLIRSGEVTQLISRADDTKLTFGKKFIKIQLHLFLFTDLFVVGKRRSMEETYNVIHYCPRSFIEVQATELLQLPTKDTSGKHLLFLTILENQDRKTIEMLFSWESPTDKQRWFEAFKPQISENPDEILYESWDCPQVMVLHNYNPQQPDELPLEAGDVVNVTRKMADGWYMGERIRDGRVGWFPGNHVTEVASAHVRARNLKQRYRILAYSTNFLELKKK